MSYRADGLDNPLSVNGPHAGPRYMTYDGEGIELGMYTLKEAQELGPAEFDPETRTITVDRE